MKIKNNSTLLFIGDSITSAARNFDLNGEGSDEAYGDGYVRIVKSCIDAFYTEQNIRMINMGIGGNTIRDLHDRWQKDVLEKSPTWLSIKIGINDVWRQFDRPLQPELHVLPEEYESTYRKLLEQTRASLEGLVIVSPFVISSQEDSMRKRMDEYAEIAKKMANEFDAIYVDTQVPFDKYLKHRHANDLCWDRIHPRQAGHMLIANAWLNELGFKWPI